MKRLRFCAHAAFLVLLCACTTTLQGQTPEIHHLKVVNGLVTFDATFSANPNDSTATNRLPDSDFSLGVLNEKPVSLNAIPNSTQDTQKVSGPLPAGVFPGKQMLTIYYEGDSIAQDIYQIKSQLTGPGQQPMIVSMSPHGTLPGRVVTLEGKGFGNNIDDIYIWFSTADDTQLQPFLSSVINPGKVTYLTSPDANGLQQLKFIVAGENAAGDLLRDSSTSWLESELRLRVVVKGQPSANTEVVSIVASFFRTKLLAIVVILFITLILLIWFLYRWFRRMGSTNPLNLKSLVVDQTTNRLSLSKLQALAWTVVLAISYTYYILMTFLILDQSVIPDFDASLLILMGISTSGLLIARSQDKSSQQKAEAGGTLEVAASPSVWDLVSENGTINLASLQLLLFTVIGIGVYIVYMTSPELVETGLPTMPNTLLALMGISQGGYITGKAVEGGNSDPSVNTNSIATVDTNQATAANPNTTATPANSVATTSATVPANPNATAEVPAADPPTPETPPA